MVEWILPMALAPTVSSNIGHMILVYSIGCMIRNQRISPSWQAYITNRRIQILTFIVGLASAILILMALDYGLPAVGRTITTSTYLTFIGRFSIMPIIASLGLFFLFLNMQLSSRYINYISRSAFAVYLISENPNIYPWFWKSCFDNIDYYKSTSMIPIALAQCVVVFVGCVLIDIVYRLLKSHVYQLGNIKQ